MLYHYYCVITSVLELLEFDSNYYYFIVFIGIEFGIELGLELATVFYY